MSEVVNLVLRDFVRYTGDGLPNAPIGAPLPIGDPASGIYHPTKADLRTALETPLAAMAGAVDAAAASAALAQAYGVTTFSSRANSMTASIPPTQARILVFHQGKGLWYIRDATGTALTTLGGYRWSPDPAFDIWAEHWGTDANDCTAKIQAGLNYVATLGGGILHGGYANYLINSNLTIPVNVKFSGPHVDGCGSPGNNFDAPYEATTGALILNSAATITVLSSGGINGWLIYRSGMTFPTASAAAFAGTAITINGDDVVVRHNMIMGFNRAIDLNDSNRPRIESNNLDNVNGVRLQNCFDTPYLTNNHAWPFATIEAVANGTTPGINSLRSGIAYELISGDWAICVGNFSYGYAIGHFSTANSLRIIGGGADNAVQGGVPLNAGSVGFQINGARNTLVGVNSAGNTRGVALGTPATAETQIIGLHVWGNSTHGVIMDGSGMLSISNSTIKDANLGITINNATAEVIDGGGNIFQNTVGSDWNFGVASNTDAVRIRNISTTKAYGGSPVSANLNVKSLTAAATLSLPLNSDTFLVNGNANISAITGFWPGRAVTLIFTGVSTIVHGTAASNRIALADERDFLTANRKTLSLVWSGAQWIELGRISPIVGYSAGGGAVTQLTSRTTGVSLTTPCGAITLVSAAGSPTWASFLVTNPHIAVGDTVLIAQQTGANLYQFSVRVGSGGFILSLSSFSGTAVEAPILNFAIIKAVSA